MCLTQWCCLQQGLQSGYNFSKVLTYLRATEVSRVWGPTLLWRRVYLGTHPKHRVSDSREACSFQSSMHLKPCRTPKAAWVARSYSCSTLWPKIQHWETEMWTRLWRRRALPQVPTHIDLNSWAHNIAFPGHASLNHSTQLVDERRGCEWGHFCQKSHFFTELSALGELQIPLYSSSSTLFRSIGVVRILTG